MTRRIRTRDFRLTRNLWTGRFRHFSWRHSRWLHRTGRNTAKDCPGSCPSCKRRPNRSGPWQRLDPSEQWGSISTGQGLQPVALLFSKSITDLKWLQRPIFFLGQVVPTNVMFKSVYNLMARWWGKVLASIQASLIKPKVELLIARECGKVLASR